MKKLIRSKAFLFSIVVALCLLTVPSQAGFFKSLAGSIFQTVMDFFGFTSDLEGYCWFCPLFSAMFDASNRMMTHIMGSSSDAILMMLGCGTLLFIAFKVGATVVKLQEVDLMQFLGELFKVLGRVIIASAIIASSGFITKYILSPFLAFSFQFALELVSEQGVSNKLWKSVDGMLDYSDNARAQMQTAEGLWNSMQYQDGEEVVAQNTYLNNALKQSMVALLAKVSANLVVGMAVGVVLIVLSMFGSFLLGDLPNALSGIAIFGAFTMIYISIPFKMINMLVQLAFVMALMPFWVALWVFKATAQYTKKAFDMLLHTCLTIITTAILLVLVFSLIGEMLPNSDDILTSMIPGYDLIAGKKANVFQSSILLTMAIAFLCKELVNAAPELATRITQSYGVTVGDNVASSVAQQAGAAATAGIAAVGLTKAFGKVGAEDFKGAFNDTNKNFKGLFGYGPDDTIWDNNKSKVDAALESQKASQHTHYTPPQTGSGTGSGSGNGNGNGNGNNSGNNS